MTVAGPGRSLRSSIGSPSAQARLQGSRSRECQHLQGSPAEAVPRFETGELHASSCPVRWPGRFLPTNSGDATGT